ncbi:hypothetical protein DV738_g2858, partial [Chaetothyriales sp. CBS 135597]
MFRVPHFLSRARHNDGAGSAVSLPSSSSAQSLDSQSESEALVSALDAVELVLNDDIAGAEAGLAGGTSAFHKVAFGTLAFLKAVLGAEQEAEAQVMMAVVGVLSESLTESIRAFYRLRKAYLSLDALARMEENYLKNHSAQQLDEKPGLMENGNGGADEEKVTASMRATSLQNGHAGKPELDVEKKKKATTTTTAPGIITAESHSPLDVFICSGTNLMFGVLNLLISIVPPAFSKLLAIVGFHGDRDRALKMLWHASEFHNINGGLAALVLFGWYNGLLGFCDIIPDAGSTDAENNDTSAYPGPRLEALLHEVRQRHPKSPIWMIEEARMASSRCDLNSALDLLSHAGGSTLKQVEAMRMFETSLDSMYAHRYELCADSFVKCVDLNAWSQAMYYFVAGAAHVEAYRELLSSTSNKETKAKAEKHKTLAEQYIRTAPTKVGKKKMMGRQLPFDVFVVRKVTKWTERAAHRGCGLIEAIGVSPLEEMIYLWGGYKKMDDANLEHSLRNLACVLGEIDEKASLALLRSVILRNLRRYDESMALLKTELLPLSPHALRGAHRDDWPAPAAHHEMAVNLWMLRSGYRPSHARTTGSNTNTNSHHSNITIVDLAADAVLVQEAKTHLTRAKNWDRYELEARLGIKVTAGLNTHRQY